MTDADLAAGDVRHERTDGRADGAAGGGAIRTTVMTIVEGVILVDDHVTQTMDIITAQIDVSLGEWERAIQQAPGTGRCHEDEDAQEHIGRTADRHTFWMEQLARYRAACA